jgi:hypothetical protein
MANREKREKEKRETEKREKKKEKREKREREQRWQATFSIRHPLLAIRHSLPGCLTS